MPEYDYEDIETGEVFTLVETMAQTARIGDEVERMVGSAEQPITRRVRKLPSVGAGVRVEEIEFESCQIARGHPDAPPDQPQERPRPVQEPARGRGVPGPQQRPRRRWPVGPHGLGQGLRRARQRPQQRGA